MIDIIDLAERGILSDWLIRRGIPLAANVSDLNTERRFDRVLSVEMFENVRNNDELLRRISTWLKPAGRLMVHIFCHARFACPFETKGQSNRMGRHFFTG
ncbi:MAG: methyltransferase domain-containing protein [Pirellulales bacterium]|nr:methyltransferase domain-containing protein [Pirellulales bacterium]